MEVRRRERHVAERRDLERALDAEALGHRGAVESRRGGAPGKSRRRERERTERVARADAEVVVGRPDADVVEALVDDVAVAVAHRPVDGRRDPADRGVGQLGLLVAVRAADVRRPAGAVVEQMRAEEREPADVIRA